MAVQQVKLGVRQINRNEVLSLKGVMEMTFTNHGRDMFLAVGGVSTLLKTGSQLALPSGMGCIYGNQDIELTELTHNIITKTLYSHPTVNSGAYTANKSEVYGQWYQDNAVVINANPQLIISKGNEIDEFLRVNHIGEFSGLAGGSISPWMFPAEVGLTANFNLYTRWMHYKDGYTMPMPTYPSPAGGMKAWSVDFFSFINHDKLQFLRNELSNTSATYNTIIKLLTATNEVATFDALIGNNITGLVAYAQAKDSALTTSQNELSGLEQALANAISSNALWDKEVTTISKKYAVELDNLGQATEAEFDEESQLPINVHIIYTIKEA